MSFVFFRCFPHLAAVFVAPWTAALDPRLTAATATTAEEAEEVAILTNKVSAS